MAASVLAGIIQSLADPTRRRVYERLVRQPGLTVQQLTRGSGVSQPAISQHLRALKRAHLVVDQRNGRHVHYRVHIDGLAPLADWIERYGQRWRQQLDALRSLLDP